MDTNTDFELFPYTGAGLLKFGMAPDDAENLVGPPDLANTNHLKQRVEFRSFMNVAYAAEQQTLVHFGFGRQMEGVRYKGIPLFQVEPTVALQRLVDEDGHPYVYFGFVVLLNIGMTLTGFHDRDVSQQAITMFPLSAWDSRIPKLKPFRM